MYTVLAMHADEDTPVLQDLQKHVTLIANTAYARRVKFVVQSATPGGVLAQEIADAILTVALISPDFGSSLWMLAFPKAYELASSYGKPIVPIYIRPWSVSNFKVHMTPPTKAIAQWKNKDAAWSEVDRMLLSVLQSWYPGGL